MKSFSGIVELYIINFLLLLNKKILFYSFIFLFKGRSRDWLKILENSKRLHQSWYSSLAQAKRTSETNPVRIFHSKENINKNIFPLIIFFDRLFTRLNKLGCFIQ